MCDINKTAKLSAIQGEMGVEITMVGDLQEMGIKYRQYVRDLLVGKKCDGGTWHGKEDEILCISR